MPNRVIFLATDPTPQEDPMSSSGEFVFRSGGALDLVTARTGGTRAGCLVVFACQVSIEPERFQVAISTANYNHRVASAMDSLAVHLLPGSAADLANLFGETTATVSTSSPVARLPTDPTAYRFSTAPSEFWSERSCSA